MCYALRMVRVALAVLLTAVASLAGCQRLTGEQCDELCWRYNEVSFWQRFEGETRGLGPAERGKLRAEREKIWTEMKARKFDPGLENCIRECRRSATPDDLACVERAKTAEQAGDCLD